MEDRLKEILDDYFDVGRDTYAYNLTRDKRAFDVGTITLADFEEFDEDTTADLAHYLVKNGVCISS